MENCPLCKGELREIDKKLHDMFELHRSDDVTWKPEKGHWAKEIHDKCILLLNELDIKEGENKQLKFKLASYTVNKSFWQKVKDLWKTSS